MNLRLRSSFLLTFIASTLLLTLPLFGQDAPLTPTTGSTWAASDALYWGLPVIALLLSWIVGIGWHMGKARTQYSEWPSPSASGSFGSLCGLPIILTIVFFLAVAALFAYICFGRPELADEWLAHQKTAYWAWPLCIVAALAPWTTVTATWRRA